MALPPRSRRATAATGAGATAERLLPLLMLPALLLLAAVFLLPLLQYLRLSGQASSVLTGLEPVAAIGEDGSPGSSREIAMWNPPVEDEALQLRRSPLAEAAEMVATLTAQGARSICFMKSRKGVELVSRMAADELSRRGHRELAGRVAAYRAGYTPQQRRELESRDDEIATQGDAVQTC